METFQCQERHQRKMSALDLNAMSLKELRQLQKEVEAAIETFEARQKEAVRRELEELARARGFTLAELAEPPPKRARKSRSASPAKYRNPQNPQMTWSGRGRRPDWVNAALNAGATLEQLRIA